MTKNNKSAATIRRRKLKPKQDEFHKFRESCQSSPITSEDEGREEDEDCYLFDDDVLGPLIVKKIMASDRTLFLGLVALRVVNSLLIQTYFVPDEYWQSLEVAHNMVFHYGYLTWEWQTGIRSYSCPLLFAILFKLQHIFGLDSRILLIKFPRLVQGVVAACGDLYLYRLSRKLCDRGTAQWTLLCQTISWFTLYCSTRTLTNSTESVLVVVALYYFPWPHLRSRGSSMWKFLCLAAASVIVRPTAAIIWILMCSWHLQLNRPHLSKLVVKYIQVGLTVVGISAAVDRIFYGRWIFVQYNFLHFNVLSGGGTFYGSHPWHWYITQGYPVVMATHMLPFVLGAWNARNKVLLFLILWTLFVYSFLSHKEFRFLMPILPLSMHYCGVYFQSLCKKPYLNNKKLKKSVPSKSTEEELNESFNSSASLSDTTETQSISSQDSTSLEDDHELELKRSQQHKANLSKAKVIVLILLITNIPLALYFCLIHQRGTVDVMKQIYDSGLEKQIDVLFLMPCHSTPYYSYIHTNISMRFLTCEPNLKHAENYTDEAEVFYHDPVQWLKQEYVGTRQPWPTHLVYFNTLQTTISPMLLQNGYKQCAIFFHTHLPEGRIGSHVIVSCR